MSDDYQSYRNNPDSLGRKLRSSASFPFIMPANAKLCWFDVDGTVTISDEDGSNSQTGFAVKADIALKFLPERVASPSGPTKIYYVI